MELSVLALRISRAAENAASHGKTPGHPSVGLSLTTSTSPVIPHTMTGVANPDTTLLRTSNVDSNAAFRLRIPIR